MSQPPPPPQQPPDGTPPEQPAKGFGAPQAPQGQPSYGYPQQPPPPPGQAPNQGGYGYPQQPPPPPGQPPQGGGFGPPQQPPPQGPPPPGPYGQQGPYYQPQPYGQGPGMYPTMPPGGSGGGNSKIIAIVAAAVAVVLAAGVGGFLLLSGGGDSGDEAGGGGGASQDAEVGQDTKPQNTEGKKVFDLPVPSISGSDPVSVAGGWVTQKVFAKSTIGGIQGIDAKTGAKSWKIDLDGEICAASPHKTSDGKTAVIIKETKSSKAPCSQMVVIDLNAGKKVWQEKMPGAGDTLGSGMGVTVSGETVAAAWIGGSVGYKASGGEPIWKAKPTGDCRDAGYAGGKSLFAVVECGSISSPSFKVQKLDPASGKQQKEYEVPGGVQTVRVAETDPLVLVVGAGDSTPTDVMTFSDSGKLKAKITLGERYDTGCGTEVESCNAVAASKDAVYLPSKEHQGDSDYGRTNEVMAFDYNTGKPKWKSAAGEQRSILPLRMSGSNVIAYKLPTYDKGGEVVSIEPGAGKQTTYLKLPNDTVKTENSFGFSSYSVRSPIVFEYGRLLLQESLVSNTSTPDRKLAAGFGGG